jgi:hypothetical protein
MTALRGVVARLCRASLNAWDVDSSIGPLIRARRTGRYMGALSARRSRPDRGRVIVVGNGRMLIDVGADARPVGWEHGSTVEGAAHLADWRSGNASLTSDSTRYPGPRLPSLQQHRSRRSALVQPSRRYFA